MREKVLFNTHREEKWGSERSCNLPRVTQLVKCLNETLYDSRTYPLDTTSTSVIWAAGIRDGFTEEVGLDLAPVIITLSTGRGLRCHFTNEVLLIKNVNEKKR